MDPVSKLSRILMALRLQQSGTKHTNNAATITGSKRTGSKQENSSVVQDRLSLDQLHRRISERISRLPSEDWEGDKAVQLFVDSVLAWEFGEEILESGSFLRYSKQIRAAIKSDSKLNHEFELLLKSIIHTS